MTDMTDRDRQLLLERQERWDLAQKMHDAGISGAKIGLVLGVTRQRVSQMLHEPRPTILRGDPTVASHARLSSLDK